ncbi:MAG: lysophospholipid acyltransferase family protein [Omnitrophica WOR_2 bacterium]
MIESADKQVVQDAILRDMAVVMGFTHSALLRFILKTAMQGTVQYIAGILADFDKKVAEAGLAAGMQTLLARFVRDVEIRGKEGIPEKGPLLIVSNHPAAYDMPLIAASLPRDDLQVISSDITFISCLPATARYFMFIGKTPSTHMVAARAAIQHLKAGGSVLLFPRGNTEPDPAVSPGAAESMQRWSPSLEIFLRQVPETQVIVTIVSGVLSPGWMRSPITWVRKEKEQRQKIAEIFQVIYQVLFPGRLWLSPQVDFSRTITTSELIASGSLLEGIRERAREMLGEKISK